MNTFVSLKEASDFDKNCKDHDHIFENSRGYAHSTPFNLNYKYSFVIQVVFHNRNHYDSHFIIKGLAKSKRITVLPINKEKYISVKYSV